MRPCQGRDGSSILLARFFAKEKVAPVQRRGSSAPVRRGGGIGRHAGLKILWMEIRAGSIPALGTRKEKSKSFGSPRFARRLVGIQF